MQYSDNGWRVGFCDQTPYIGTSSTVFAVAVSEESAEDNVNEHRVQDEPLTPAVPHECGQ